MKLKCGHGSWYTCTEFLVKFQNIITDEEGELSSIFYNLEIKCLYWDYPEKLMDQHKTIIEYLKYWYPFLSKVS